MGRWIRALLGALLVMSFAARSEAFVVEGPRDGARDAIDNLLRSPRWGLTGGSLERTGERGLGGGLEYAIDDSLCELRFVHAVSCADIRDSVQLAAMRWGQGHPALSFTDVTGRIAPARTFGPGGARQGAEIDFFADMPSQFPPFQGTRVTGYTIFYERPSATLVLTNGQTLRDVGRIESVDVRLNAARCYYIDLAFAQPDCVHFPSLVLHEIGHALGLDHPDEFTQYNLDSDTDPGNRLVVNCRAPEIGLQRSPFVLPSAVLVGQDVQGPGRWKRGLSWDDVAGRDALYPHCGIEIIARDFRGWGAFALSDDGRRFGRVQLADSEPSARRDALADCGTECRVVAAFEGCFALARGANGRPGVGQSFRSDYARVDAMLACSERDTACEVQTSFCAFD